MNIKKEKISKATVSSYLKYTSSNSMREKVYRITKPWNENRVHWNSFGNYPGYQDDEYYDHKLIDSSVAHVASWMDFDITEAVKFWIEHPDSNFGIIIKYDDYSPLLGIDQPKDTYKLFGGYKQLATVPHTGGYNDKLPRLEIEYHIASTQYEITSSAIGNGSIALNGTYLIDSAANQTYTLTADRWHRVDSVLVDGINVGTDATYEFTGVKAGHTIVAYFGWDSNTPDIFKITSSAGSGGAIAPAGAIRLTEGTDTTVKITPNTLYLVDSVLVDGKNLGPLTSVHFRYLSKNHTIESFFRTKDYLDKYPVWNATYQFGPGLNTIIVSHNGHLWHSKSYWNQGNTPVAGSTKWADLGEWLTKANDTVIVSSLEYISNKAKIDTLIITTETTINSVTTTTIDTIADFSVAVALPLPLTANVAKGYILQNGTKFFAPSQGIYSVSLFDLRGRLIKRLDVQALKAGVISIPINRSMLSKGVYLMRLSGKKTKILQKVTF